MSWSSLCSPVNLQKFLLTGPLPLVFEFMEFRFAYVGVSESGLWFHLHFCIPFHHNLEKQRRDSWKKMLYETCWKRVEPEMMLTRGLEVQNRECSDQI